MSEREIEPIFCSECQNEMRVQDARTLDGKILCPADLAKHPLVDRMRARRLPEDYLRRGGAIFRSVFTSFAALMLVVGVAFIVKKDQLATGVWMIVASVFVALTGVFVGDVVDLLLDIFDQLKQLNRRR